MHNVIYESGIELMLLTFPVWDAGRVQAFFVACIDEGWVS